jgi:acyl-CoA synthetase (AMP-forming)/AMP-acid ligase II
VTVFTLWDRDDDQVALLDPVRGLTIRYGELSERVDSRAAGLIQAGVSPGDRVVVSSWTGVEAALGFLAILRAGATALPVNPRLTTAELTRHLPALRPGYALVHQASGPADACAALGVPVAEIDASRPWRLPVNGQAALPEAAPDSIALILQTSGTTGRPKGVPLTQANLAASTATIVATYGLDSRDTAYCIMPLFHVHGLIGVTLASLAAGGTVVIPARLRMRTFWDAVTEHDVSWTSAVPTLLAGIPAGPRHSHRLRFLRSASSPLPPTLAARLEGDLDVPVLEAYGMTEATHQMASNPMPPAERRPGSVGVATNTELDAVDESWTPVGPDEPGEVVVRGPSITSGYLDHPEANAASFRDGWFRTGDIGRLSADGYLRLVGRVKEMINRAGEKISPREVDEVLLTHPGVIEAATYGVPDAKYGEVVHAAVVTREAVEPRALMAYCGAQLAAFKVPVFIHVVDAIPKGATGKVQRSQLAQVLDGP